MSSRNKQDFPARDFFEKFTVNARYKFKTEEKKEETYTQKPFVLNVDLFHL